jgi:hypothetical protein
LGDDTARYGLEYYTGLWNGVGTGDCNEDGRLGSSACNWSSNTQFESHRHSGVGFDYGDIDRDDRVESLLAYYDLQLRKWVPPVQRDELAQAFPFVKDRFQTHEAYGQAGIDSILGAKLNSMQTSNAAILESMLFINHGETFEARPLPAEAQMSPGFALCVADFDGDGHEDVFLSQNFFGVHVEKGRYDAGRGLWLRGNGQGEFTAVPGHQSGIKLYGEQRGAAVADYDADGRVDLAVTQNGSYTRLFHNQRARPGLRVRLKGTSHNPNAIGAQVRLIYTDDERGPIREIQAGSGYWSQNSVLPVLGMAQPPQALWIRWPAGKIQQFELPSHPSMATVSLSGEADFR